MEAVLPSWLDQVQGVDFEHEKQMLKDLEDWARRDAWAVSDGRSLPFELASRTDVLLTDPTAERRFRVAVLPKSKGSAGSIRLDASSHRVFELLYRPKSKRWRVETGTVPLRDDFRTKADWDWLVDIAFRK